MMKALSLIDDFLDDFALGDIMWSTKNNERVSDKDFKISIDLPGVEKDNISVSLNGEHLRIAVNDKRMTGAKNYRLSDGYDLSKTKALYKNGLLTVEVPKRKKDESKWKNVQIDSS